MSTVVSPPPLPPTLLPDDDSPSRRFDEELSAMNRILKLLADLDDKARERIMKYLYARYANEN